MDREPRVTSKWTSPTLSLLLVFVPEGPWFTVIVGSPRIDREMSNVSRKKMERSKSRPRPFTRVKFRSLGSLESEKGPTRVPRHP